MKVSRTNSSAVIRLKQKLPSGEFVYVAIQKRVSFTREYKEVDTFDVKSWFICHFYLLVCFDKGNRTCAYVMFQTTQLSVLLLLIKNVPEKAFIREGRGNISMNAMCSNKIFGVTEKPKKG